MTASQRKRATPLTASRAKPTATALAPIEHITAAPVHPTLSADDILSAAARTIAARGVQRDSRTGAGQPQERSMAATVAAFNAIEGTQLSERQGWAFMQVLKMVRGATTARNGLYNEDDALDGAAYAALGGEAAAAAARGGRA